MRLDEFEKAPTHFTPERKRRLSEAGLTSTAAVIIIFHSNLEVICVAKLSSVEQRQQETSSSNFQNLFRAGKCCNEDHRSVSPSRYRF